MPDLIKPAIKKFSIYFTLIVCSSLCFIIMFHSCSGVKQMSFKKTTDMRMWRHRVLKTANWADSRRTCAHLCMETANCEAFNVRDASCQLHKVCPAVGPEAPAFDNFHLATNINSLKTLNVNGKCISYDAD